MSRPTWWPESEHPSRPMDTDKLIEIDRQMGKHGPVEDIPESGIMLEDGDFGTYLIIDLATGEDLLIQTDWDFPGVASSFGWIGDERDIQGAIEFLDDNIGAVAEDPGYFSGDRIASKKVIYHSPGASKSIAIIDEENNAEEWWDNGGRELWDKFAKNPNDNFIVFQDAKQLKNFVEKAQSIPGFESGPDYAPTPFAWDDFSNKTASNFSSNYTKFEKVIDKIEHLRESLNRDDVVSPIELNKLFDKAKKCLYDAADKHIRRR